MRKKDRHQMYKPGKSKVMKMKDELHDMEDMCDIDDMDDMDEDLEEMDDMKNMTHKKHHMGNMEMHHHMDQMNGILPQNMQLAHSYVLWQTYEKAFTPPEALMKGTLFPELWGVYKIPK